MRGPRLLAALLLIPFLAQAQVQNALDFDGINDAVTVANGSALVAGVNGFSMTCWIKPTAGSEHHGIVGLRDEAVADFYMLKLQNTNILEGRLRNSGGTFYTLNYGGLTMNAWQHLAMVYDGSQLILYHNGAQVTSVTASGGITSTTGTFHIGNLPYSLDNFNFDGPIDEVSLWSVALTAQQVDCIASSRIDTATPGLELYYTMDQGVAGGNNTGVTSLVDAMGNGNGTFTNMTLQGTSSNFVAGATLGTVVNQQVCPGDSYTFNGQVLTQPGTYTASFTTGGTCDSLVTLVLGTTTVNINVVQSGNNLVSQALGAQYQWLDCSNGYAEVTGATAPSFQPTTIGTFAVEVTQNGCVDTSACYPSTVGLAEGGALATLQVFVDAAQEQVVVTGAAGLGSAVVRLHDAQGRVVMSAPVQQDRTRLSVEGLPSGAYLVEVSGREGRRAFRVVVAH
ncbi:MAG: T9SS type A sorting domain-containing protein [Flavobacteriales bacterium]|nr:T9SS type A sorting domain-containing protein [Flavobacteriales bacterium]